MPYVDSQPIPHRRCLEVILGIIIHHKKVSATTTRGEQQANSITKRKSENDNDHDDKDKNYWDYHADTGAAAADRVYSGLTHSLDTRADSKLFHKAHLNTGGVKAMQIQELDPKPWKEYTMRCCPLRVMELAGGEGVIFPGHFGICGLYVGWGSLKNAASRSQHMHHWFETMNLYPCLCGSGQFHLISGCRLMKVCPDMPVLGTGALLREMLQNRNNPEATKAKIRFTTTCTTTTPKTTSTTNVNLPNSLRNP